MSIIIRGMKLPKEGRITIEIGSDGAVYSVSKKDIWGEKYESDFPAVELPPHGRLIDADALKDRIRGALFWSESDESALDMILNSPTIIEAEEVKE